MLTAAFLTSILISIIQSLHGCYVPYVHAQITPFRPNAIPLAVKTPYMNFWLLGGRQGPALGNEWPKTVAGSILGWVALVRVDGTTYTVMGGDLIQNSSTQLGIDITPTQTNFVFKTGPVNTKLKFLSPIHPTDYTRMSLPFTYLAIEVESTDDNAYGVQVYVDVTGELLSGDTSREFINWSTTQKGEYVYHEFGLQAPQQFLEKNGRIEYGRGYHATAMKDGVSFATCPASTCRTNFATTGTPAPSQDMDFRVVSDRWPVMALSHDLKDVVRTTEPLVFIMGQSRDPLVQYQGSTSLEDRSAFFQTQFRNIEDAISFSLNDYKNALAIANSFDSKLKADSMAISTNYFSVLALAARQVFARMELTVGKRADGSLNPDDTLAFLRTDRTSAIEELYASAPFWLYTNPELLRLMLQPFINEHKRIGADGASSGVVQDLGPSYPRVTGNQGTHTMPIEATGDFLIMTTAYVRASGNASIITDNYGLFDTFANYLNDNTLNPSQQTSADSQYVGMLTGDVNLAVKGIIALKAYGDLISRLGKPEGSTYINAAIGFAQTWQQRAVGGGGEYRLTYTSDDSSWSIMYNLFADKWLGTDLFPEDIYKRLSSMYQSKLEQFGVPTDSRSNYTKPEWMLFAAGLVPDTLTRDKLIDSVSLFLSSGPTGNYGWCDLYEAGTGKGAHFGNRAVVGGVYSLLARDLPVKSIFTESGQNTVTSSATQLPWNVAMACLVFGLAHLLL